MAYGATVTGTSTEIRIVDQADGSGEPYSALSEDEQDLFDQALEEEAKPFSDAVSASGEHFEGVEAVTYGGSTYTIVVDQGKRMTNRGSGYGLAGAGFIFFGGLLLLPREKA